eukprot:gene2652-5001_t
MSRHHYWYIQDKPPNASENKLRKHFTQFGDVLKVHLRRTAQHFYAELTQALVTVWYIQDVPPNASEKKLHMHFSQYIQDVPPNASEKKLHKHFSQFGDVLKKKLRKHFSQFGEVLKVDLPINRTTRAKQGYAFVLMNEEGGMKAIEDGGATQFLNGTLVVSEAQPRGIVPVFKRLPPLDGPSWKLVGGLEAPPRWAKLEAGPKSPAGAGGSKLYVQNLPWVTDRDELVAHFKQFVEVIDVEIPKDRQTGRSKGFGFLTVAECDAEKAIAGIHESEFSGMTLRIKMARGPGSW